SINHPMGSAIFDKLLFCVFCQACFTACQGESMGMACPPPMGKDVCDVGMGANACFDQTTNPASGCIPCSEENTCKGAVEGCKSSSDCIAYNQAIQSCPTN